MTARKYEKEMIARYGDWWKNKKLQFVVALNPHIVFELKQLEALKKAEKDARKAKKDAKEADKKAERKFKRQKMKE